MTGLQIRPYQVEVINQLRAGVAAGQRRILLVAPTGSGKTIMGGSIVASGLVRGSRVLWLAHRRELIQQAQDKLFELGVDAGIIQAGFQPSPELPVQIASIPTLHARAVRTRAIEPPPADLIIVDEAHHIRARSWKATLALYPDAVVIGLSATPCRGDGRGLGNVFDIMVECPSVQELIDLGFLVPTKVYAPSRPDLTGVRVERGDYVEKQLAEVMDRGELVGDIVTHWLRLAERRKTVIFATSVAHSVHLRDEFRRAGVLAEHIDGSTPLEERDGILRRLSRGEVEAVANCAVLTEGWDQPDVNCIVLARPTRHMGLFRQMIGRVLRPAPGKDHALVLDHAGNVFQHGFVEEPVHWTLSTDRRAENPMHGAGGYGGKRTLTTCPECHAVRRQGAPCGACGWQPRSKAAAVEVVDGELAQIDRALKSCDHQWSGEEKAKFYRQLLWIAREKSYRDGWAAHKHKEKFGHWPEARSPRPEPPEPAVRSWVRSRQIAYAKAMEKRGAA
jgi:DNA repair protein RadD